MTREEEIKKEAFEYADKELIGIVDFKKEAAFIDGAMWADRTMIDKVCEWLKEEYPKAAAYYEHPDSFIDQFKQAMKGGKN